MAKSNYNQDHFKIGGREPLGQGRPHELLKNEFGKEKKRVEQEGAEQDSAPPIPGATNKKDKNDKNEEVKD
jgi:hypothetical protein